ncbi:MAG: alkaline phosphatase [Pelagibacterium sp. SCN 64-44]|nr:MAG: alkaline phosphatase [Pelagibacterium sp. SCN 64-44]
MIRAAKLMLAGVSTLALTLPSFAQDVAQAQSAWYKDGEATIEAMIAAQPNTGRAKNVILFVADGMGVGTNYAIRLFAGQMEGKLGEEHVLPYEAFPNTALIKTYNINAQTPDSAPTAGAMNTGVKQVFNTINLNENGRYDNCASEEGNKLTLFSEIVAESGKSIGVVSTARATHATPAAVYAKTANRNWEAGAPQGCTDIAVQAIEQMEAGVVDVLLAGGARNFIPSTAQTPFGGKSSRQDDLDLVARAQAAGARFVTDRSGLEAVEAGSPLLGLFTDSDMNYETERPESEPSVADMTVAAIKALQGNENGFYLMVEGGRVDHANHAGNANRAFMDGVAFARAVALADEMTDDADTLIIVTADHEHAIAFNGYCGRGTPITGLCMGINGEGIEHTGEPELADDGKPYSVVGYLNGAGSVMTRQADGSYFGTRPAVTQDEATDVDYLQQALIPMGSETHSGEDVAAWAKGPWAHLLTGTREQNYIFHVMNHAVSAE